MSQEQINPSDLSSAARKAIRKDTIPSWVTLLNFDLNYRSENTAPITQLLVDRQVNAESCESYLRIAARLETMQAVQNESQWRIQFEPRSQSITLHWIKIHRGEQEIDHTDLNKIRLLQREEGLERLIIDGWFTIMLLLEDVRPGDVLDWSYTIQNRRNLLPESCQEFFSLPQGIPIGKYRFSVLFNTERKLLWKCSVPNQEPVKKEQDGSILWEWSGENQWKPRLEANTPDWFIGYYWIQISDCQDWGQISAAIKNAWHEELDNASIAQITKNIEQKESELLMRVDKAIQFVQDDHRYLSLALDIGGYTPAPPAKVAERRFGDCKDLSFLLVHLLKHLGIKSRPILVNTRLRHAVANFLPMFSLFDHVIVEFSINNETRWVDPTCKRQGGGALKRYIPDFGVGLPVDLQAQFIKAPRASIDSGIYELTETILLNTYQEQPSYLSLLLHVTGSHADTLRCTLENIGLEALAQERLQISANRFRKAIRLKPLQCRDDRERNEIWLAEAFTISGFLSPHPQSGMCTFQIPPNIATEVLRLPEKTQRHAPLALPYPLQVIHTFEIESGSLKPMAGQRVNIDNDFVEFSCRERSLYRSWSLIVEMAIKKDSVSADRFDDYEDTVKHVWQASVGNLACPLEYSNPVLRDDFGELPIEPLKRGPVGPQPAQPTQVPKATSDALQQTTPPNVRSQNGPIHQTDPSQPQDSTDEGRSRLRRKKRRRKGLPLWFRALILMILVYGSAVAIIQLFLFLRQAARG